MSELEVKYAYTLDEIEVVGIDSEGNEFYLKSEVDKVIAEKDKVITYASALVREDIKLILHQKYKRCLAMASRCKSEYAHRKSLSDKEQWYWRRWYIKWLELAEKFNEAK